MGEQDLYFLLCDAGLNIAAYVVEAVQHAHKLQWIELLGLDQHFFTDTDLAEIMKECRVTKLLDLFAGKTQVAVGSARLTVDSLGQSYSHLADTVGMP